MKNSCETLVVTHSMSSHIVNFSNLHFHISKQRICFITHHHRAVSAVVEECSLVQMYRNVCQYVFLSCPLTMHILQWDNQDEAENCLHVIHTKANYQCTHVLS